MSAKAFLDTNILVYAATSCATEAEKKEKVLSILSRTGLVVSTQVIGEFYNVVTSVRRISPLSHEAALDWIDIWLELNVYNITVPVVRTALRWKKDYNIHYYDALILSAAQEAECPVLYSEDLNNGQIYGSVTVVNPFAK